MSDLESELTEHFRRQAGEVEVRSDLDAVRSGRRLATTADEPTPEAPTRRRVVAAVAAVTLLAVGVGALYAASGRGASETSTTPGDAAAAGSPPPRASDPAEEALPVMPASAEGTELIADCIVGRGLDVRYDSGNSDPGITYDNSVVGHDEFDEAHGACVDQLVRSGEIYGLGPDAPTGPGIAVVAGSPRGTELIRQCLRDSGIDATVGAEGGITYDNRVVGDDEYDETHDACLAQLVESGDLVPLGR